MSEGAYVDHDSGRYSTGKYDRDGHLIENDGMEKSIGSSHEILEAQANAQKAWFANAGLIMEYFGMYEPWNLPPFDRGRTRD